jgi:hypothetical protein
MLKWPRSPISILIVAHSHPDRRATPKAAFRLPLRCAVAT